MGDNHKAGRPTDYTDELAAEICSRLSTGDSLRTVCKADDMPNRSSVFLWLSKYESFSNQYAKAKEEAAEAMAEEMFDIADNGENDWMERNANDGGGDGYKLNGENIQRSKLRVDVRKWYLSKIKPKKYGEAKNIDHTSSDGSMTPVKIERVIIDPADQDA